MDKTDLFTITKKYLVFLKQNDFDFEKAYLFGSYAKGDYNKDSDIDLAIVFNNLTDSFSTQVKLLMLTTKFDTRIEPHPIDKKDFVLSNPFVYEILKYGYELEQ